MVEEKAERWMIKVKVDPILSDNLFTKIFSKNIMKKKDI